MYGVIFIHGSVKNVVQERKVEFMNEEKKDLLDGIEDLGWINKDGFEYYCESCGWQGDSPNYEVRQRDYDDEGYPISSNEYIERCPICDYWFDI